MGSFNANPTLIMAGVVTSHFRPRVELSQVMRTAAHEVEKLATDGLSAAEVDQFFRLAGIMIQNLNIERYGRK